MNKDQVKGRVEEAKGKVKEVAGKVLACCPVATRYSQTLFTGNEHETY